MKSEFKAKLIQHLLNRKDSEKGFTLIELLVVVVIIGILAAIALPTFLTQVNKSRQAEARNFVATTGKLTQAYFLERNIFPPVASDTSANNCPTAVPNAGWGETNLDRPGLLSEGGVDYCLKYYTVSLTPGSNAGNTATTAVVGDFRGSIKAVPNRPTLKGYVNTVWAARLAGAGVAEVFTIVGEQVKAGLPSEVPAYEVAALAAAPTDAPRFAPSNVATTFVDLGK